MTSRAADYPARRLSLAAWGRARPDTAYHRLDLFRARVQQAAAEHGQDIMTVLRSLMTSTPWRPPAPAGMSP